MKASTLKTFNRVSTKENIYMEERRRFRENKNRKSDLGLLPSHAIVTFTSYVVYIHWFSRPPDIRAGAIWPPVWRRVINPT